MKRLLLLPSARLLAPELQSEFGQIPTAMVPLDSRPVLHYIVESYGKCGYDIGIAVHEQSQLIYRYLTLNPDLSARVVEVGETSSLGETIYRALQKFNELPDELIINFADTLIGEPPTEGNVICYRIQDDVYRWTTFQIDEQMLLTNISDKGYNKVMGKSYPVFVGVFAIADVPVFYEYLSEAVDIKSSSELDPFYDAIKLYFNQLPSSEKTFRAVEKWWDFGHIDTYNETKRNFFINKRVFNQVQVDNRRGILRKTSTNVDKFIHEISWYLKLPKQLKYIAPQVFDYSLDYHHPYVELEYYGYPALNDVYLFGNCNIGIWNQIFKAVFYVAKEMSTFRATPGPEKLTAAMRDMYEIKTQQRLAPILADSRFAKFAGESIIINGKTYFGLAKTLRILPDIINALDLYSLNNFSIIHGDLCLSNILYDPKNRIIRLVDPRGMFGTFDIYGDPRYDIAKLCHSIEGDYDFIVNGLFDLNWENDHITFKVHIDKHHLTVKELFKSYLQKEWSEQYLQIKFIEALLFLSMVPLHSDRPHSQQAFLARGLEILTHVVHSFDKLC